VPFFGDALSFSLLSIFFIDLQLIFIVSILGFINSLPTNLSKIQFKSGDSISDVFLLEDIHNDSILILTPDDQKKKIMKDSIFWTSDNSKFSPNNEGITQIGNIILMKTSQCIT
jgi:hypothetical protein